MKILNPFTTPPKRFFENEEIAGMFRIMGYQGYSKKFDPEKFKPAKVVIATDADADGKHIECLLFGVFLRYLPFVLTSTGGSKLFVANPPLYGADLGRGKMKFFADNVEYIEYVQDSFCKANQICDAKGKPYSKKDITKILHKLMNYGTTMDHICSVYSVDPLLLEFLLYNKDLSFDKLKTAVKKAFKFLDVSKQGDSILIRGLVGPAYQTVFLNDRMLHDCAPIIDMINRSENYYIINGTKSTIYQLIKLFNAFEPKITRFKGLGEMQPSLLGLSTVLPGQGRILKQYTIDDVKKELKLITELQSDKAAFTKGIKVTKEDIL